MPRATYRVQLHAGFTFDDAREIVPYLARLGISHMYCSPVLAAVAGSTHGYDIVDHARVNPELGGEDGFERLTDALRAHDMGLVLDIVPNHMAMDEANRWWWDVLEHGPRSPYVNYFDIDWERNRILLPVLPADCDRILAAGEIRVVRDDGRLLVAYGDQRFPLDPRTVEGLDDIALLNRSPERLGALLAAQHYRLASWRCAATELNYRRFFDINSLIGLRMEDPDVFAATHSLVLGWVADGRVDGLRIDHPDGLRDPVAYLARLRAAAPEAWIVVEKILMAHEPLPADWPVDGTTGYRFANLATGLMVDPAGEPGLTEAWAEVADGGPDWEAIAAVARREVLASVLGSDVNRLTRLLVALCDADPRPRLFSQSELRDALAEMAAALGVYRTYLRPGDVVSERDSRAIDDARALATRRCGELGPALDRLGLFLRLEIEGSLASELALRFQQLTPAAMAKGVEDTAFYRHHRLVALNEVGGDPGRFGTSVAEFHGAMVAAQEAWPLAMLALSTHDTKRSADLRARLALISEDPLEWDVAVGRLTAAAAPHRTGPEQPTPADAYLFFQVVIGAWPIDAERAAAYMDKASREAKLHTSWTAPNAVYGDALSSFAHGCLADAAFVAVVEAIVEPLVEPGWRAALAQLALQLTAPGVPDIYQGSELWDLSLVDPDNRRTVDYDLRRRLLDDAAALSAAQAWERKDEGIAKLWLIRRALEIRSRRATAFGQTGTYRPLPASGERAEAVVAFARRDEVVTVAPRLVRGISRLGWGRTTLPLPPGRWLALDGREHHGAPQLGELLDAFPVAILERSA